ncbi:hypothetical protein [Allomuricauda sp. SCSIO 65647]|uniref:hypothetical protein n=1 Tax=Allomuricauda sp. SCSIO 65647 TaxID=2908843 RepID=UPI001F38F0F3|nr:hypothetical protein [Muricauda sp. SCSIO 65647]UJH67360.1 hypothetical protein L0P89_15595 [Muricauda sp. SCSIO 65647]
MNKQVILALLLLCSICFGQKQKRIVINLDVDAREFKSEDLSKIPFDQHFFIYGKTKNEKIKTVEVRYKLINYKPGKHYFFVPNEDEQEVIDSLKAVYKKRKAENKDKDDKKEINENYDLYIKVDSAIVHNGSFKIFAPKLHPNEYYSFEFIFKENINLPEAENKKLRLSLLTTIDGAVSYKNTNFKESDIIRLRENISQQIEQATGNVPLYDKDDKVITDLSKLLIKDKSLKKSFDDLANYNKKIVEAQKKLFFVDWKDNQWSKFEIAYKIINELSTNKESAVNAIESILASTFLSEELDKPVNSVLDPEITLKGMLEFILNDYSRSEYGFQRTKTSFPTMYLDDVRDKSQSYILEILTGNAKIKGNIIEQTAKYDQQSAQLLLATFIRIQNLKKENGDSFVPAKKFETLNSYFLKWLEQVRIIESFQADIDAEKEVNVNILKDVYTSFSFTADTDTFVTIDTKETPYVGIDFGILVAPEISSTFLFEGLNFHIRPVNRNAKFSDLQGLDMWLKRTSIFFGVAQRVGSYDDNYKNLIGVGSPFVGLGFRINRMIRLNGGFLFYKTEETHPLSNATNVESTYFLSASIDIELKEALKILGGFL